MMTGRWPGTEAFPCDLIFDANNKKAVFFDMDGTLLPMDTDLLVELYLNGVSDYTADIFPPHRVREIMAAARAGMYDFDGKTTNDIRSIKGIYAEAGDKAGLFVERVLEFYDKGFDNIGKYASKSREMREAVDIIKDKGYRIVVVSNPVFPLKVQKARLIWAGFSPDEFEFITGNENMRYCKPDLRYYQEALDITGLSAHECFMVGNDVQDDMVTIDMGFSAFYIKEYAINRTGIEPDCPSGDYDDFLRWAKELEDISEVFDVRRCGAGQSGA
ncbi:MAG: HAD family hydrolase [Christensenellales bacterium]|jgi:HAD superfamily hydrolase (TIGR01549 family)